MYGQVLPNQNGAPIRLVIPWKYGFKSAKSLVRIRLTADEPKTAWNKAAPQEYGFYSNVNPEVDHPRWSQATERRIGEFRRRETLMFNGYAPGGGALRGDGSQEAVLVTRRGRVALKVAVWARLPRAARVAPLPRGHRRSDRQPDQLHHQLAGRLDAAHPAREPGHDAAAAALRLVVAGDAAPAARPVRVLLRLLHFAVWLVLDHFFAWGQMGADIVKRPYITVGHGRAGADDPAGRHLHRGRDPAPGRGAGSGCTGWST